MIAMLMVAVVAGGLCWATLKYQRATGTWAFHPLDAAWWSPAQSAGVPTTSKEVLEDARIVSDQVGQALWGTGGLIERADAWWRSAEKMTANNPAAPNTESSPTSAQPQTKPSAPEKKAPLAQPSAPSSVRGMLEQRLHLADQSFQVGLTALKSASPIAGDATLSQVERVVRVGMARDRFAAIERDLSEVIPAYEALPGHDVDKAATARQLRSFNQQMLELTGGMPTTN
jgi:hypothetical protein